MATALKSKLCFRIDFVPGLHKEQKKVESQNDQLFFFFVLIIGNARLNKASLTTIINIIVSHKESTTSLTPADLFTTPKHLYSDQWSQ